MWAVCHARLRRGQLEFVVGLLTSGITALYSRNRWRSPLPSFGVATGDWQCHTSADFLILRVLCRNEYRPAPRDPSHDPISPPSINRTVGRHGEWQHKFICHQWGGDALGFGTQTAYPYLGQSFLACSASVRNPWVETCAVVLSLLTRTSGHKTPVISSIARSRVSYSIRNDVNLPHIAWMPSLPYNEPFRFGYLPVANMLRIASRMLFPLQTRLFRPSPTELPTVFSVYFTRSLCFFFALAAWSTFGPG